MAVCVASGPEAAALDAEAIANGIPSRALMRVAACNAATVIANRWHDQLYNGVLIYTGPGNNGGDGWALARAFIQLGIPVAVHEVVPARSPDAIAEREQVVGHVELVPLTGHTENQILVDAILGTGAAGEIHGEIAEAALEINVQRGKGARVVSLDLPTGVNADTGSTGFGVYADVTIAFGTCKRGHLLARQYCGEIVIVDIGLEPESIDSRTLPKLVTTSDVHAFVPEIRFDAHKGDRGRVTIIAGNEGMGGAALLAAEGAVRSGAGLVKVFTHPNNVSAFHARLPQVIVESFPNPRSDVEIEHLVGWTESIVIGPGLGHETETRQLVEEILQAWHGPIVLDADALNVFAGDVAGLAALTRNSRACVITPHPGEFARLISSRADTVDTERFDIGLSLARELNATIVLKGTPTIITLPNGTRFVMANGTPTLATGGSGDILSGMIGALLAQEGVTHAAAVSATWVHARAAELCGSSIRGGTLHNVMERLPEAWSVDQRMTVPVYPALAQLPRVV